MTHRGIGVRLRQLLAVFAFLALTFIGQSALAAQVSGTPTPGATPTPAQSAPPANAQGGVNTLVQPPPIQGQGQPMLFEKYGPLDYAGLTTSQGLTDINVINDEGNGEAMAEATAMYLLGIVTTRIVEWCFSLDLVSQLGPTVDQFTQGLENTLYQEYLPAIIILAAIIVAWTLLVMRRFLGGLTGVLWAGFTISMAIQLFASPASYLNTADQFASGVTNSIVTGIAQEDPGAPKGSYEQANGDANYEVRLLANRLWTVSVYDPWTMIEFGTVDPRENGNQLGVDLLNKNDGQSNTYDQDIQAAPQWIQQWADGNWGVPRAMFGLLLALLGGILLVFTLFIALTVIVGTLTAIVLACLTVPIWLLAPIPGFGQRLLVAWFGGIFAGLAVSTLGALYLVLVLALLGAVQQLEGTVGLITVGVLDVGLIVVALWLRKVFFHFGRHVARVPVAAVGGQPLALASKSSGQSSTSRTVYHRSTSRDRQRVPAPTYARTARSAGAAGPAPAAAGAEAAGGAYAAGAGATAARAGSRAAAARAGAATAGAGAGATVATAGTALLALTAVKAGHAAVHAHDAGRRRVQAFPAGANGATPSPARAPRRLDGHTEPPRPDGHAEPPRRGGHAEPPRAARGRVGQNGVNSWRGPRIDPPAADGGGRPAGRGPGTPPHKVKGRVETPRQ